MIDLIYAKFRGLTALQLAINLLLLLTLVTLLTNGQELLELSDLTYWGLTFFCLISFFIIVRFEIIGYHWSHWLVLALGASTQIIYAWPGSANHLYAYLYLCLILSLSLVQTTRENRIELLRSNSLKLLLLIMLFAGLQKLITPGYLNGDINAFWMVNGGYFKPLQWLSAEWQQTAQQNHLLLDHYFNTDIYSTNQLVLSSPITHLKQWSIALSIAVIVGEVLIPLFFAFSRNAWLKHLLMIGLIVSIFLSRQESGFLSMICIMALVNSNSNQPIIRGTYLLLVFVMQGLVLFELGYS